MAQLANVLDDDEKAQLAKDQQAASNQAWRKSSFFSVDSAKSNAITVAVAAMSVAFPPMAVIALARLAANAMNANKAADAARKEAEKEFIARQQAALALESQKLDVAIKRQQLATGYSPQSAPKQQNGSQERVIFPKQQPVAQVVMPRYSNANPEPAQQDEKTTETSFQDTATATVAQSATVGSPLNNETLEAAEYKAEENYTINLANEAKFVTSDVPEYFGYSADDYVEENTSDIAKAASILISLQDVDGNIDEERAADAFYNGVFDSFAESNDTSVAELYNATKMMAERHNQTRKNYSDTTVKREIPLEENYSGTTIDSAVIESEVIGSEALAIEPAQEQLAFAAAKEDIIAIEQDYRDGDALASELYAAIAARQLAATR
jgi:hypothetical protein